MTETNQHSATFSFRSREDGESTAVVAEVTHRNPSDDTRSLSTAADETPLQEKVKTLAAEQGIDPALIDMPTFVSLQTDADGYTYVSDLNDVIRYYPEANEVVPTDAYLEQRQVHDSTQRVTDINEMYQTA